MREISADETNLLYECMEDLGRHHNNTSVYFKGIYPTIPSDEIVKQFADDMRKGISNIAVIEENDKVVGLCKINIEKGSGVLDYLVVLQDKRGQGYGAELMNWAFSKFDEFNVKDIEVKVVYGNDVINLYKKYGFKEKSIILLLQR